MLNTILVALLSFNMFFGGSGDLLTEVNQNTVKANSGTLKKMIVADGTVSLSLDLNRLDGTKVSRSRESGPSILHFSAERDSFFTIMVFNDELRGPMPSSMKIIPQNSAVLPAKLQDSYQRLVVENLPYSGQYEMAIRDEKTGFVFFNIEGQSYDYNPSDSKYTVQMGRLVLSTEYANTLGRPTEAGSPIGQIYISATMRPSEVTQIVDGETTSTALPTDGNQAGTIPGPDVVVGDITGLIQSGINATHVGLAIGTDSCNFGTIDLNWFANPSNDHPVIPQNVYRMSGGADNTERLEQIGQSQVKHAFTALTQNICALGCNGVGGTRLGSGCSDPYSASLNSGPSLGSKAWINPFTGFYPRNDSATPNNSHTGHTHSADTTQHRVLTRISDLNTTTNAGATYYAEAQYVTPHEYAWCQTNPTQCNMYNNVSYRRYNVTGTTTFSFSPNGSTQRLKPAIYAWTGATIKDIKPAPGVDGVGLLGYKVTNPSAGVWHYEYAIYNQNIDRAIQSFRIPLNTGVVLSNVGFSMPPQHPGSAADGTLGNAGFSSAAWTSAESGGYITWGSETFAVNENANAIRWGTMYTIRFDSNRPPMTSLATIGFLKTGAPINVAVQIPSSTDTTCSRLPQATRC